MAEYEFLIFGILAVILNIVANLFGITINALYMSVGVILGSLSLIVINILTKDNKGNGNL